MIAAQSSRPERPIKVEATSSHATLTRSAAARDCWERTEAGNDWTRFVQVPRVVCDWQFGKHQASFCHTVWILRVHLSLQPKQIPLQVQRAANTVVAGPYRESDALDKVEW